MSNYTAYQCPRCEGDSQPAHFGSPRNCAFLADGSFTPDNWNCATLSELFDVVRENVTEAWGDDESLQAIPALVECLDEDVPADPNADLVSGGFIVLTRYKQRGRTSSAVHVGDFWPYRPVTLALVDRVIERYRA